MSMQVDFGKYWMYRNDARRVKVYFFAAVMSHSRHKFTYFSRSPFTSEPTGYAHPLDIQFYGAKPQKVIRDQDKVLINSENLGDVGFTKAFQAFVSSEHFKRVGAIIVDDGDPISVSESFPWLLCLYIFALLLRFSASMATLILSRISSAETSYSGNSLSKSFSLRNNCGERRREYITLERIL